MGSLFEDEISDLLPPLPEGDGWRELHSSPVDVLEALSRREEIDGFDEPDRSLQLRSLGSEVATLSQVCRLSDGSRPDPEALDFLLGLLSWYDQSSAIDRDEILSAGLEQFEYRAEFDSLSVDPVLMLDWLSDAWGDDLFPLLANILLCPEIRIHYWLDYSRNPDPASAEAISYLFWVQYNLVSVAGFDDYQAREWLQQKHEAFRGRTPLQMIRSESRHRSGPIKRYLEVLVAPRKLIS
jgi:hypothetical protein